MLPACLVAGLLALSGTAHAAQSSWNAAGGLTPDAVPSPYQVFDSADPEDPVLNAGALTLSTSDNAETMGYRQSDVFTVPDPWIIEFEMRYVSGSSSTPLRGPAGVFVSTAPNVGTGFHVSADSIFLVDESSVIDSAAVDTDDAFHKYRIEIAASGDVAVYHDDVLTLQGATYFSASDHPAVPRVTFGMASILSNGTSEWKSFGHNGLATSSDAQININIAGTGTNPMRPTETAGAPAVNDDNWNNLGGTTDSAGPIDLVGGDGLPFPGATVSWAGNGAGTLNDGAGSDDAHMRSTNFDTQSYPAVDVSVSGVPFAHYDVYAYHEGGVPSGLSRIAHFSIGEMHLFAKRPEGLLDYTESTATMDLGTATPAGNHVVFRGLTTADFTLTAGGGSASDGTRRNRFSAIQIVESVPTTTSTTTSTSSTTTSTTSTSTVTSTSSTTTSSSIITSTSTTSSTATSTSSSSSTSTPTIPPTTTSTTLPEVVFPPGKKLKVKQKKSGSQRLQVLARSADIAAALPCEADGELIVSAEGAGTAARRFPLDASRWKPIKRKKPERGCKYKDAEGSGVSKVLVKPGKALSVIVKADDVGVPLTTDPRPVRIELRHGDVRHCLEFDGGRFKVGKKLQIRNVKAADVCPVGSPSGAFVRAR